MNESILTTIKGLLGITEEYSHFDNQIIAYINTVWMTLYQIGVGKKDFSITSDEQQWTDFLGKSKKLEAVKTYVYLKVKLVFDPPQSASVQQALKQQADELEWRLNVESETEVN